MCSRLLFVGMIFCAQLFPVHADDAFHLVVMDPLSKPLSCDCVQGYAQRKYELLGEHLTKHLRIHKSDNKRYSCEYCHKAFRDRYELVRHTRRHTGDFPFR